MHQALHLPEIFDIIFDFATTEESLAKCRTTALNLALTNKRFLEQGLNFVWRDISEILHLVRCFPQDLWRVKYAKAEFHPQEQAPDNILVSSVEVEVKTGLI